MFERFQNTILDMIARGRTLEATADRICREAEFLAPDATCSILTVDSDGLLHPLAGPSLPVHFSAALDGIPIGPAVGSCGTAAYRQAPVTVTDIATDPLWTPYKALALPIGLKACWSSPIVGGNGVVLATFAFYYRSKRGPSPMEAAIVGACIDLCSIALEREISRRENHRFAYFDSLTGLRNRASFNDAMAQRGTAGQRFGLLLIDIDRVKRTNDTYGHLTGDALIRDVAARIAARTAPCLAYRVGGDEFAVIVADDALADGLDHHAARILSAMMAPAVCGDHTIVPVVTIGGGLFGGGDATVQRTHLEADLALYHAKENGRGTFVPFTEALGTTIALRTRTLCELAAALVDDRIETYYQPIVRLDTREIVGLEALCRMKTSDGRIVPASMFMEAIQDISVSTRLTECMMTQVAADVRLWLDQGIFIQHVSINVTTADFQRGDLQDRLARAFARHRVPLKHLILEVTETVSMGDNSETVATAVKALRSKGLLVALDDFGTGYASLTHLLTFPVDIIKIDKSFVDRIGPGDAGDVIIQGLIDIAGKLDIRIVAEGIETEMQASHLQDLGCALGQGYYFAVPSDRGRITELLLRFAQKEGPVEVPRRRVRARTAPR